MRIIFVEPRGSDDNVFAKYMSLPLLGPVYLATMLKEKGYDVKCYNENMLGRRVSESELQADILCISALTSTVQRGYKLIRQFKALNPKGKAIIGGIHASMMPDEAVKYADHVFVGEGEGKLLQFIESVIAGTAPKLTYSDGPTDMDLVPTPDFELLSKSERMPLTPVITSRGCPFDCTFCSVTQMFGKKYRTRSIPRVIEDLKSVKSKKVFFYDDNFTAMKKRSYELIAEMKRNSINKRWTAQVRSDVANDPKLVEKMADSGCYTLYVGFESINPETLKEYNKGQTPQMIKNAIKTFHDNDIQVHGMFMFGADADDKKTFRRTLDFCSDTDLDFAQFMVLTPLPGTKTFNDLDKAGRLIHKDWKYYEGLHVVFKPKQMTAYELQRGMIDTFADFYSYTKVANQALNAVVDVSTAAFRSWYSNVEMPSFSAIALRTAARGLVTKWRRQNSGYMDYLGRI